MSRSKDKSILVEGDPEPERTLKRKLREAKAQLSVEDLTEFFKEEDMAAENNNNAFVFAPAHKKGKRTRKCGILYVTV